MYKNYGDRNFLEHGGFLVDTDHSDNEFPTIMLRPYDDDDKRIQFADITVNIRDDWIDRDAVKSFCGSDPDNDPVGFAIGCVEYYGAENFGAANCFYDWRNMTREEAKQFLKNRLICADNVNITW